MQFELSQALMDDILFSMEDQDGAFVLDTEEGAVAADADGGFGQEEDEAERYLPLPHWGPAEGFRLMERFTAGLHNPLIREELSAALDRGRGVFRAFKDAVARYPEMEKRWFRYKEREMKREILRWYNALRELWGLELIGAEPEDLAGLVLEDFRFRAGGAADLEAAAELHRASGEAYREGGAADGENTVSGDTADAEQGASGVRLMVAATFAAMSPWVFPGDLCLVAETSEGEFAACLCGVYAAPSHLHVHTLEVKPEYQGLGLGDSLLDRLLEAADQQGIAQISLDLPAGTEHFSRVLIRKSFEPCVQRYCRLQTEKKACNPL